MCDKIIALERGKAGTINNPTGWFVSCITKNYENAKMNIICITGNKTIEETKSILDATDKLVIEKSKTNPRKEARERNKQIREQKWRKLRGKNEFS